MKSLNLWRTTGWFRHGALLPLDSSLPQARNSHSIAPSQAIPPIFPHGTLLPPNYLILPRAQNGRVIALGSAIPPDYPHGEILDVPHGAILEVKYVRSNDHLLSVLATASVSSGVLMPDAVLPPCHLPTWKEGPGVWGQMN